MTAEPNTPVLRGGNRRKQGARPTSWRTCLGCRARDDRNALLRVVVAAEDAGTRVRPDPDRRLPGRGASLHPRQVCLDLAERRRAFGRALRRQGPLDTREVHAWLQQDHTTVDEHGSGSTPHERSMSTQR